MKRYLFLFLLVLVSVMFSSCAKKDCTCSKWTNGVNTDTNPVIYSQDEIDRLNVNNCAGLSNYLGYDEKTGTGYICE